ncbi:MAG TPA: hypothetical protein VKU44_11045 [Terriglobia bacterium]|nr:hypothetical protein [Terriglobia bacterium]
MKAKKAIKKLSKARVLVTSIVDQYAGSKSVISSLLDAASANINRARTLIEGDGSARPDAKPARKRMSKEGRKRLSQAAKKRWAKAKRAGFRTLAARG